MNNAFDQQTILIFPELIHKIKIFVLIPEIHVNVIPDFHIPSYSDPKIMIRATFWIFSISLICALVKPEFQTHIPCPVKGLISLI